MQPVPLPAKKQEVRPLLVDRKEAKEDVTRRRQQILKREEEKENRVGMKEEQATNSWKALSTATSSWRTSCCTRHTVRLPLPTLV